MPEDTDKKDGPQIGTHRQPQAPAPQQEAQQPAQQAWVPAKPSQQAQAAGGQQPAAPVPAIPNPVQEVAAAAQQVAGDSQNAAKPGGKAAGDDDEEMSAKEKLKAGMQGILSGSGGSKEGKLIGEAVGEGIKNLFGQGGKDGAKVQTGGGGTQVGPGAKAEAPKAEGPVIGGHRQQGAAKQEGPEAGGLDV